MRYAVAPLALAALAAATPVPQGVTQDISPDASAPSGCETTYDGEFNIQIVNQTDAKRSLHKRQSNVLTMTLADGVLTDSEGRTGYIAANSQFQFDAPPQTGAIYTAGWSVCADGHLTLGDDDTFYSCLSGNFYNLYDENVLDAEQCNPVYIMAFGASGGAASVMPDGQPTGSAVSVMPDGQPTGSAVAQIPDGQITGSAVAPVTQIPDGQIQATSAVTQIADGQIQAPTSVASPVSQIADGQIQAPTSVASPVSQIADGQIQAPTSVASPVSQIPDGQIQAPTYVAPASTPVAPVTQITDGQIQAPTGYVSQISDGQIQAPTANGTMVYPSVPVQTGNGASGLQISSGLGLFAAIFGVAML